MDSFIIQVSRRFSILERWFDRHFGWFFTNGMKEQKQAERADAGRPS